MRRISAGVVCVLVASLIGCGGGDDAGAEELGKPLALPGAQAVVLFEDSVWVGATQDVVRVDAHTQSVTGRVAFGDAAVLSAGEGAIYALRSDGFLARIDAASLRVTQQVTLEGPVDVAAGLGAVWAITETGKLLQLDPRNLKILRTEDTIDHPTAIAVGRESVVVGNITGSVVYYRLKVQPPEQEMGGVAPGRVSDIAAAPDADEIWVAVLDVLVGMQACCPVRLGYEPPTLSVGTVLAAAAAAGGNVWAYSPKNGVYRFDAERGEQVGEPLNIDTDAVQVGLAADSDGAWLAVDGQLRRIVPK